MDWAVDFIETASKDNLRMVRETLDAKHQAGLGNYGEAARILWELTVEARHTGDRRWETMTQVHLGKVYRVLRWSIAVKLLEQALATAEELGFDRAAMMALNELGEMRCSWGQLSASVKLLEQALTLSDPEDTASRRDVLLNLVVAYEGLGDLGRCCTLLEQVVRLDRQLGHPDLKEDLEHLEGLQQWESSGVRPLTLREAASTDGNRR